MGVQEHIKMHELKIWAPPPRSPNTHLMYSFALHQWELWIEVISTSFNRCISKIKPKIEPC